MKYIVRLILWSVFIFMGHTTIQLYNLPYFLNFIVAIIGALYLVHNYMDYQIRVTIDDKILVLMFDAYADMLDKIPKTVEKYGYDKTKIAHKTLLESIEKMIKTTKMNKFKKIYYDDKLIQYKELTEDAFSATYKKMLKGE